ncbi:MAG: ferrous iron transport protein A [Treponema sp.]|jgi:ferrous iron transport protein A|nr:ferrous iron transport protein A [Treponema sp.]
MPLSLAKTGEANSIKKIGGHENARKHLENMGFVTGTNVTVVSTMNGGLIVKVKDSRIAISREMANKIII